MTLKRTFSVEWWDKPPLRRAGDSKYTSLPRIITKRSTEMEVVFCLFVLC